MSFVKSIIILAAASMAFAAPWDGSSTTTAVASSSSDTAVCGNGQTLSCCSSSGSDDLLTGLNCLSVPVLAVPIEQACGSNVAACCQNDSATGAIALNLACTQIPL